MIPQKVLDAIKTLKSAPIIKESAMAVGDIRPIQDFDGGDTRLALILDIDNFFDYAIVTLIHPYVRYATEHDLVIGGDTVSMPYDVVVQCDIRASVWKKQIGRLVGHLPATSVDELMKAKINLDTVSSSCRHGSKLTGPLDVRWNFKVAEGRELKKISQDCTIALIEDKIDLQVDDLELMTAILRSVDNYEDLRSVNKYEEMLLCFYDFAQMHSENVRISLDTWSKLEDLGLLDENRWKDSGFDVVRVGAMIYGLYFKSISTQVKKQNKPSSARSANTREIHITLEKLLQESSARAAR